MQVFVAISCVTLAVALRAGCGGQHHLQEPAFACLMWPGGGLSGRRVALHVVCACLRGGFAVPVVG
eukprot:5582901-Alexandrium_andersonii.AAC.1